MFYLKRDNLWYMIKICIKCHRSNVEEIFRKNGNICKKCHAIYMKRWMERNKERNKNTNLPNHKSIKFCTKCQKEKPTVDFYKSLGTIDGLASWCKKCASTANKQYSISNTKRETIEYPVQAVCTKCKQSKTNEQFYKDKSSTNGLTCWCKECYNVYNKKRQPQVSQKIREKRQNNPIFRLEGNLRARLQKGVERKSKSKGTITLLGCTGEECMEYLESLFWPGMTRENMGKGGGHIDHIIPVEKFDLSKEEEQKRCFHYTNLQPLWEDDNHTKWKNLNWSPSQSKHELPDRLKS